MDRINGSGEIMQVKIKVLINSDGKYCGYGYEGAKPKDLDDTLYEVVYGGQLKEYWLTADLPVPVVDEVAATVIE
ncbi:hypothetical protein [Fimbriiglobus ruber]|nr:hypothetical protein [Fimbriiglobus ruber]